MRLYRVSADTSEKEKVIGGILTMVQGIYLGVGIAIALGLTFLLAQVLPPVVAIIIACIIGLGFGCSFAFLKVRKMPLMDYLFLRWKFGKQTKFLINTLNYRAPSEGPKEVKP